MAAGEQPSTWKRTLECVLVFFLLPMSLYWVRFAIAFKIVPIILLIGLFSHRALRKADEDDFARLWRTGGLARTTFDILKLFVPAALVMTLAARWLVPEQFFAFPSHKPLVWAVVMLLYPLLAAGPQELFFRALFFSRYRLLCTDPRWLIALNALSFGLAHLLYGNWVAPVLSTLGGLLFAYRFHRTGSLLAVTIEHGLWGNFLFTSGYGWFFYSGAIQ